MDRKIGFLSAAESQWLDQNLVRLRTFARIPADHHFSLPELDRLFREWVAARSPEEDPNPMIDAFGTAFGQHLVDRLAMEWVVVSDEQGNDLAVCGQPGEVLVFPPNFVAKRFATNAVGFFESGYAAMAADIMHAKKAARPKPWWKIR